MCLYENFIIEWWFHHNKVDLNNQGMQTIILNFSHSPKQAHTNSSTQTLKYYRFRASALTAHDFRALVRASLSLYTPARVTHDNGSPLSINQNVSAKLARLLETASKTLNKQLITILAHNH